MGGSRRRRRPEILKTGRARGQECAQGPECPAAPKELVARTNIPRPHAPSEAPHGELLTPGLALPLRARNGPARLETETLRRHQKALAGILRPERPAPERPKRVAGAMILTGARRGAAKREVARGPCASETLHPDLSVPRGAELLRPADPSDDARSVVGSLVEIAYRDVSVRMSYDWWWTWAVDWATLYDAEDVPSIDAHGVCSSVWTTLTTLWSKFWGEARGDHDVLRSVIGCYNLPKEPSREDLFYRTGWGSPGFAVAYTLQLLYTYVDDVRPEVGECQGLSSFIKSFLEGKDTANAKGTVCSASALLNFVNTDEAYEGTKAENSCREVDCATATTSLKASQACRGVRWDDFKATIVWSDTSRCFSGRSSMASECKEPDTGCGWRGFSIGNGSILLTPVTWGFFGYVCDEILFRARIIMDCALYNPMLSDSAKEQRLVEAEQMARYALRMLVYRAGHLIHELGHLWIGGGSGHCSGPSKCCMDMARYGWVCLVRGRLGLPQGDFAPSPDGDYHEGTDVEWTDEDPQCSDEADGPERRCLIMENGKEDSYALFCTSACGVDYEDATEYHCEYT